MVDQRVGAWAFILGVIIAIVAGIVAVTVAATSPWIILLLVILGLIVGFMNIQDKQITGFLIAAIALMVLGGANLTTLDTVIAGLGALVTAILANIAVFVAPAALVVALKEIINLSKTPGA